MKGLPFGTFKAQLVQFFGGEYIVERIAIDLEAGKQTGYACCILKSPEMAQRAIIELDRK